MTSKRNVVIQYRKAADPTGALGNLSLEQAILESLQVADPDGHLVGESPKRRHLTVEGYGTLVLNYRDQRHNGLFGEIVRFDTDADLTLLDMAEQDGAYNLKTLPAPTGHQPFKGVIYFLAVGSHVAILEQDVSSLRAEQYFSWLFAERTRISPANSRIILDKELTRTGDRKLAEVQTVTVQPKLITEPTSLLFDNGARFIDETIPERKAFDLLIAAGFDEPYLQDLAKGSEIEVRLHVRFKDGRSVKSLPGPTLNRLLRNVDEDELTLEGPGGREQDGRLVKVAYKASVIKSGVFFKREDVVAALVQAYSYFREHGLIDR